MPKARPLSAPLIRTQKIVGAIPCPIGCVTNLMVFNQSRLWRDSRHRRIRSKNNYRLTDVRYVGAADTNQVLWLNTNPAIGGIHCRTATESMKKLTHIRGYLITHNIVRCSSYFVCQCLDSNDTVRLGLFALIESLCLGTKSDGKIRCLYICP